MKKKSELALLREEVAALRKEIAELKALPRGETHTHHHYDWRPALQPTYAPVYPQPYVVPPYQVWCGGSSGDRPNLAQVQVGTLSTTVPQ